MAAADRTPTRGTGDRHLIRRAAGLAAAILVSACGGATAVPLAPPSAPPTIAAATPGPAGAASASPRRVPVGKGRVDKGTFRSGALSRTLPFMVYLPPGYDADPAARFPTAYVLHGGSGLNTEWVDYGLLAAAERLMTSGEIPPFIIALPQGDQEYWVDHVIDKSTGANGEKWGTYTAHEVVQLVDQRYRTIATPSARAIGGLSMGGHGSMQLALNFPGIWSAIAVTSPALRPEGDAPTYLGFGVEFAARDPLALIRAKPDLARQYTWWIDTARTDPWIRPATAIHETLASLGIAHEWSTPPGDHSAAYWSAHVEDYLRFYASVLCADGSTCPAHR